MTARAILHCDINCCYAQIECQAHPELRAVPLVVGGDEVQHTKPNQEGLRLALERLGLRIGTAGSAP